MAVRGVGAPGRLRLVLVVAILASPVVDNGDAALRAHILLVGPALLGANQLCTVDQSGKREFSVWVPDSGLACVPAWCDIVLCHCDQVLALWGLVAHQTHDHLLVTLLRAPSSLKQLPPPLALRKHERAER
eukprot:5684547-Prymnesium_polylepis.1